MLSNFKSRLSPIRRVAVTIVGTPGVDIFGEMLRRLPASYNVLGTGYHDFHLGAMALAAIEKDSTVEGTFQNYAKKFLELSEPKVLLSFVDNDYRIWRLARDHDIPLIVVQNGVRGGRRDFLFSEQYPGRIDSLLCFNRSISRKYESIVEVRNSHVIGSLRNNASPVNSFHRSGVAWISQYVPESSKDPHSVEHNLLQMKACRILQRWSQKSGVEFSVIGRHSSRASGKERLFFSQGLGEGVKILPKEEGGSYGSVDMFRIVASVGSTLAHESLTRGGSVFFFNLGSSEFGDDSLDLGWPESFNSDGAFWHSRLQDEAAIGQKLNSLYTLHDGVFRDRFRKQIDRLIGTDSENVTLRSVLMGHVNSQK